MCFVCLFIIIQASAASKKGHYSVAGALDIVFSCSAAHAQVDANVQTQVFGLVVVWPLMVGGTAVATYLIVTNQDAIAARLGFGFASTVLLSAVNVGSTMLVHMTVVAESWHPRLKTNVRSRLLCPLHARPLVNLPPLCFACYSGTDRSVGYARTRTFGHIV